MRQYYRRWVAWLAACAATIVTGAFSAVTATAADPDTEFFERRIRPALVTHCAECHFTSAKSVGGQLLLDSRAGIQAGGDSGPALKPGDPETSLLIRAIRYRDETLQMPPRGRLPDALIADFEEWVRRGAPDPRIEPTRRQAASWADTLAQRRNWWSLQPLRHGTPPDTAARGTDTLIDRYLNSSRRNVGVVASSPAAPLVLARRLALVLTGLPPEPELVDSFLADCGGPDGPSTDSLPNAAAVEKLVDRLLASPRFGERWARHWLDVVRFTETHGNEWNYEVHHAWRYRDYLIRALNADVPYDQWIREHLAGDLLPQPRRDPATGHNESVIGTAFYRFGEVNHDDCIGLREIGYDLLDNQIDTLTKAFQATTVACARCHDHKLDAVSTQDYYGMLGILRSSRMVSHTVDPVDTDAVLRDRLRAIKAQIRDELAEIWLRDTESMADHLLASLPASPATAAPAATPAAPPATARDRWTAALAHANQPLEEPLQPWRILRQRAQSESLPVADVWTAIVSEFAQEAQTREQFNTGSFETWADFRSGQPEGWEASGLAASDGHSTAGELLLHPEGLVAIKSIVPAGYYSSQISEKRNAALRSPVVPQGRKHISFRVLGQRSSAVRLVSNHCQLNYRNYRALTSDQWTWVTFSPPDDSVALRTYAELLTMFDNPKFPDQLSALGGDGANYRLPWAQAAANPRSWFGVTHVVRHDTPEPPRATLDFATSWLTGPPPATLEEAAQRFQGRIRQLVIAWKSGRVTDAEAMALDGLVRRELLSHRVETTARLNELMQHYRQLESALQVPTVIPGVGDSGQPLEQPVFIRGDCHRPSTPVARGYLQVLSAEPITGASSGRLELAERIATPTNPLTARVLVNRVWHHLFGAGLVRTVDDFGHGGEQPSHPELLDDLAADFIRSGWSTKRLIRKIVLSQAFQQSARPEDPRGMERDPENRLLWHYPARRLEAEAIRDSILAVSGRLNPSLYGPSVQPYRDQENSDRRLFPGPLDGDGRRSVYIKNNLMEPPRFLGAFNTPGGKVAQGRRDVTTVPAQSLALLNDAFVRQQSEGWAQTQILHGAPTIHHRITDLFRTALGRPATEEEQQRWSDAVVQFAAVEQVATTEILSSPRLWAAVAQTLFASKEFLYIP